MQKLKKTKLLYIIGIVLVIFVGAIIVLCSHANRNDSEQNENDSLYQTNSNGQTYGYAETTSYEQIPDLIPAMGKNHIDGYMRKEDLLGEHLDEYDAYTVKLTDDELEAAREQYSNQYDDVTTVDFYKKCVDVPLYDVSGEKEVDKFTVTIGYYPYPENDLNGSAKKSL